MDVCKVLVHMIDNLVEQFLTVVTIQSNGINVDELLWTFVNSQN